LITLFCHVLPVYYLITFPFLGLCQERNLELLTILFAYYLHIN